VPLRVTSATSRLLKPAAVGSGNYSIAAGRTTTLRIIPPKNIAKMFKKRRKAVVQVTIAQTGGKPIKKLITVVAAR
jgi:hypothetical protein